MTKLYRGMDRAALDLAYNNVKAVLNFSEVFAGFRSRSERLYETSECKRDIPYGIEPRQRFDLFLNPSRNAPTWIFVHGGYWQTLAKEDFAFVARGALLLGCNVVLAEYTLAPQATMTQIVNEIGSLLDHLFVNREKLGIRRGPVCLAGHSAGGHLAMVHREHPLLSHAMAISPLVDLEPISLCWLNEKLVLSEHEIEAFSPLRNIGKGVPTTVAVGTAELPELVRHANDYATAALTAGEAIRYVPIGDRNHFTVLDDLVESSGALMTTLTRDMIR